MNRKQKLQAEVEATKMLLNMLKDAPEDLLNEILDRLKAVLEELEEIENQEKRGE